jgi:hypothetical protein
MEKYLRRKSSGGHLALLFPLPLSLSVLIRPPSKKEKKEQGKSG